MTRPPVALTVAGSDPSGGAGIQADLKTFSALGAYGTAVLTALTAQSTQGVTGIHPVPPAFVRQQLDTLVADVRIDTVKVGMLADARIVDAVGDFLRDQRSAAGGHDAAPTTVLDPVMVATTGAQLLTEDAVVGIRRLLPHACVVTPNLPEAAVLLGREPATDLAGMRDQARALHDLGARRVLLTGGHGTGPDATDLWSDDDGEHLLTARRIRTRHTHGTGCSLSSALAALRPRSQSWVEAADAAKTWITGAIEAGTDLRIGHGSGPVHHFHEIWST